MGHGLETNIEGFEIEVRRESFKLFSDGIYPDGYVEFSISDIGKIQDCLNEVKKYLRISKQHDSDGDEKIDDDDRDNENWIHDPDMEARG